MRKMVVADLEIDVVKKNIKNMHLAVYPPDGKIRLATPMDVKEETMRTYTISKLPWIRKQQRKFRNLDRESPRQYLDRETHYFFGRRYLLKVNDAGGRQKVEIKGRTIIMTVKPHASVETKEALLNEFYRAELKKAIPELLNYWQAKTGLKPSGWGVKRMNTKWGTCNIEEKRIWLNLELAKKPLNCLEYILVHELVHLLERNHNDIFTAYMNKFMPRWKSHRDELNRLPVSHRDWGY